MNPHWSVLVALIGMSLVVLAKAADLLVDEAVALAGRFGVSAAIIGATVVSLGTTAPEAAISVTGALRGEDAVALGTAVGSIVCNTGLILGWAGLVGALPVAPELLRRQGVFLLGAPLVLVGLGWACGGRLPRWSGFLLLALLAAYLALSVRWSRADALQRAETAGESLAGVLLKLFCAVAAVVLSARVLVWAAAGTAAQAGVSPDVIAATLLAFGSSVPELQTALSSVRKGHGELAVGNVIGADILNALWVTGAACVALPGGLAVSESFFRLHFPAMGAVLAVFMAAGPLGRERLPRWACAALLSVYAGYVALQLRS